MVKKRTFLLTVTFLFIFVWSLPAFGLVIDGPVLNPAEKGWRDFGLVIRAEANVMLGSVRFPNQGLSDTVKLLRDSDLAVLASFPVPAGNRDSVININYPLTARETYRLIAATPNNKYFGSLGAFNFPTVTPEITILGSYPHYNLWFSFNDITTQLIKTELEAVIDIKPGSDVNSINLKSNGLVPVAILSTGDLKNALSVDAASVIFAGSPAVKSHIEDVNGDGNNDMLLHFKTVDLSGLTFGSTEATLTGKTVDGTPFTGKGTVQIVPVK
jgi:hypothetical protein